MAYLHQVQNLLLSERVGLLLCLSCFSCFLLVRLGFTGAAENSKKPRRFLYSDAWVRCWTIVFFVVKWRSTYNLKTFSSDKVNVTTTAICQHEGLWAKNHYHQILHSPHHSTGRIFEEKKRWTCIKLLPWGEGELILWYQLKEIWWWVLSYKGKIFHWAVKVQPKVPWVVLSNFSAAWNDYTGSSTDIRKMIPVNASTI